MRGRETARVTALSSPLQLYLQLYSLAVSMNLRQNVESVDRLTEAYFSVIVNCVSCSKTLQSLPRLSGGVGFHISPVRVSILYR